MISARRERYDPGMRRSVAASALLHAALLAATLLSLPAPKIPDAGEGMSFEVQFESAPKGPAHGPIAKRSPTPSPKPTQPVPPKKQPIAENTAPPPPPPPAPVPTQAAQPLPTPPKPIAVPPAPALSETPAPVKLQRTKPEEKPAPAQSIPKPIEPVTAPPSPSTTSQPHPTKNPAMDSDSLENTLAKLRATTKSAQAPTAKANPDSGGALADSGDPNSNDTNSLTAAERGAIGDAVRPCWTRDAGALNADKLQVMLTVTTGPDGVVHLAHVAPSDIDRVNGDPVLLAFSDRAVNALLDVQCATLPLPQSMLGQVHTFTFRFSP